MPEIEFAYMTHPGWYRKKNEDNLVCGRSYLPLAHGGLEGPAAGDAAPAPPLFGVFDGMGGEARGEMASYLAAKTAAEWPRLSAGQLDPLCRRMNRAICGYAANEHLRSAGTTASLLLFDRRGAVCCHIGDSRICRYRDGALEQLTKDDVLPACAGRKAPLLQCLGIPEEEMRIRPHIDRHSVRRGDTFLICSDGLSGAVSPEEMTRILAGPAGLKQKAAALVGKALEDGRDNITVILARPCFT